MTITVKVGELRNHLSAYLRRIRKGAEVVILDRETPIGRLTSFGSKGNEEAFDMIDPPKGYKLLYSSMFPPLEPAVHAVEELLKERRKR